QLALGVFKIQRSLGSMRTHRVGVDKAVKIRKEAGRCPDRRRRQAAVRPSIPKASPGSCPDLTAKASPGSCPNLTPKTVPGDCPNLTPKTGPEICPNRRSTRRHTHGGSWGR